jgi:hypothetical protein
MLQSGAKAGLRLDPVTVFSYGYRDFGGKLSHMLRCYKH